MTASERKKIRAEYAELFGDSALASAVQKVRNPDEWMQGEITNERMRQAFRGRKSQSQRDAQKARSEALDSIGVKKVRGALGGTYYE